MRRLPIAAATAAVLTSLTIATTTTMATDGRPSSGRTTLRLSDGTGIGDVRFRDHGSGIEVWVSLAVPPAATPVRAFHGFHIHANDNPANGSGCQADPAAAPSTWFISADGHLTDAGQRHGDHAGDLPSLHVNADGRATTTFQIDRLHVADLEGRVVVLHAGPDNLGNVPVGTAPNQYTANSPEASDRTAATGNAGDRIACGEITTR